MMLSNQMTSVHDFKDSADELKIHLLQRLSQQRAQYVRTLCNQLADQQDRLSSILAQWTHAAPIGGRTQSLSKNRQNELILHCLSKQRHKLMAMASSSLRSQSNRQLHRVRIQAKNVRYSHESAQALDLMSAKSTIALAIDLHKVLGKHQDVLMLTDFLKSQELTSITHRSIRKQWLRDLRRERAHLLAEYEHRLCE
jgi:CHAD domain-containing protein